MEELLRYRWPGNVREMKNVIERAVVLTRGEYIDHDDLVLSTLENRRRHRSRPRRRPRRRRRAGVAGRHRTRQHILDTLSHDRLEQEPGGHDPRHRALDARPQDPPLRTRRRPRRHRRRIERLNRSDCTAEFPHAVRRYSAWSDRTARIPAFLAARLRSHYLRSDRSATHTFGSGTDTPFAPRLS